MEFLHYYSFVFCFLCHVNFVKYFSYSFLNFIFLNNSSTIKKNSNPWNDVEWWKIMIININMRYEPPTPQNTHHLWWNIMHWIHLSHTTHHHTNRTENCWDKNTTTYYDYTAILYSRSEPPTKKSYEYFCITTKFSDSH